MPTAQDVIRLIKKAFMNLDHSMRVGTVFLIKKTLSNLGPRRGSVDCD